MGAIAFKAVDVPNAFRDRTALRKWLHAVARDHGHSIGELNYVLLTDKALLEYNQRYLDHDEFTDVITFDGQTGTGVSGDVLMSYDRIKENATSFGVSAQNELRRVMVHGLLHLLGHGDKTKAQKQQMRELEDRCLGRL
ncbi:MAG: rRNA maturation RNase YbeY [Flavobacteriales bacterium]|nr:rRNA maturation RNase YbeY [Flavobacteriales bacterium]MBP6642973.1 rRNA maturation RNase YbeY [Flavobacteriales bacterium]MBP7155894.1 rRNA maturation RNase YbeY [Flavobacteriales bacterium]